MVTVYCLNFETSKPRRPRSCINLHEVEGTAQLTRSLQQKETICGNRATVAASQNTTSDIKESKKQDKHVKQDTVTKNNQIPWPLVRKRIIPTERPPLVGEI
jgi:hypothetical protein